MAIRKDRLTHHEAAKRIVGLTHEFEKGCDNSGPDHPETCPACAEGFVEVVAGVCAKVVGDGTLKPKGVMH